MIKKKTKSLNEKVFIISVLAIPLLLFLVFYVIVNANAIILAFQNITISGEKSFAGFEHFKEFIRDISKDPLIGRSVINSLILCAVNMFIQLPLAVLFSYCIYKKFCGNKVARFIILLPQIVSVFVVTLLFKKFVENAVPNIILEITKKPFPNLISDPRYSFGTVVFFNLWVSFGGALMVYPNAMNSISDEVLESSKIDGIDNMFYELRYMILPLIYPTLTTFIVVNFAAIFISDGNLVALFLYSADSNVYNMGYYFTAKVMTGNKSQYPYLSAAGLTLTMVAAPLTYLVKWLLEKFGPETEA